jgi:hypothetical protein
MWPCVRCSITAVLLTRGDITISCCATVYRAKLDKHQEYGHSIKTVFLIASISSAVTMCLFHQMKFDSITFPLKLSNGGHFTTPSHLHSPFQIIVVISKIQSLDYLPGYDGLGRIWRAINSRQVWYVLPWLYLLISWRTVDWHLDLLAVQEYSLIDSTGPNMSGMGQIWVHCGIKQYKSTWTINDELQCT